MTVKKRKVKVQKNVGKAGTIPKNWSQRTIAVLKRAVNEQLENSLDKRIKS